MPYPLVYHTGYDFFFFFIASCLEHKYVNHTWPSCPKDNKVLECKYLSCATRKHPPKGTKRNQVHFEIAGGSCGFTKWQIQVLPIEDPEYKT